jgi:hypothetical protein
MKLTLDKLAVDRDSNTLGLNLRNRRISPKQLAALGWVRLNPCAPTIMARFEHRDGWRLEHCGHPTANFPWALYDPAGHLILTGAINGRNQEGRAWPCIAWAVDYVAHVQPIKWGANGFRIAV